MKRTWPVAALGAVAFVTSIDSAGGATYAVGHTVKRMEVIGTAPNELRAVDVHLWYPADAGRAPTGVHALRELQAMDVKLAGGRQAVVSVALELETGGREPAAEDGERARSAITRALAGTPAADLLDEHRRHALKHRLRRELRRETRLPVARVLLPDFVVS